MTNNTPDYDVLVVGAGISGLLAARALGNQGYSVLVLDKGRSVGGRLATRRIGPGRADHGAQFFTVRDPAFSQLVAPWVAEGLVFQWASGWSDGALSGGPASGHARYAVHGGVNALAKWLARGIDVHLSHQVGHISLQGPGWLVVSDAGQRYHCRGLILTPPVPQSLALLERGRVPLHPGDRAALARITYDRCLAGMFWCDTLLDLPEPGAIQRPNADIPWIADNQRKGISPEATLVTVHASGEASRRLWDADSDQALAYLLSALRPFLAPGAEIKEAQLKRWRYASPTVLHDERVLVAAGLPPLAFAGDGFGGPRVEGAALSGRAAAKVLGNTL